MSGDGDGDGGLEGRGEDGRRGKGREGVLLTTMAIVSFRVLEGPWWSSITCFSGGRPVTLFGLFTDMVAGDFCGGKQVSDLYL